jgi:hypothetical protein
MKQEEFRKYAADLRLLAEKAEDPATKLSLMAMARTWVGLADLAEKNSHTDLVYETPLKSSPTR